MSQELIYTSVPVGLKTGSKGFCTVAVTVGLAPSWVERLESLSGYRPVYALGDPKSENNPVNWSHWRVTVSGKSKSVLSRVAFAGADYSGRSNKLAHHIILEPAEQAGAGPAWMLLKPGMMRTAWTGAPHQIPHGPKLPAGDEAPHVCSTWASVCGDAGRAGVLAESFVTEPTKPAYLIYAPGTDVLTLFEESLSLLPPAKRWEVAFSTFFTELPLNLTCAWRAVVAGTPTATEALRLGPRALVLDLTKPTTTRATGMYSDAARAGSGPVMPNAAVSHTTSATRKSATGDALVSGDEETELELMAEKGGPVKVRTEIGGNRKRLAAVAEFEEEIPDSIDLPDGDSNTRMPPQVVVQRGVPGWLFTVSIIFCILVGAAGCALTWSLVRMQFSRRLADQKQELMQKITDAESELEGFKSKANPAVPGPTGAADNVSQSDTGHKSQLSDLRKANASLEQTSNDLNKRVAVLQNDKTSLQNERNGLQTKVDKLQVELASLKKAGVGNSINADGDSQASANAIPIDEAHTVIIFKQALPDSEDMQFEVPLPSTYSNATKLSLEWPNGQNKFDVTADNQKKYQLSERIESESPKKISIQTLLPVGTDTLMRDIIDVEVTADQLKLSKKPLDSPSAISAIAAAQAALEDSVFIVTTRSGDKDNVWRLCLNRSQKVTEAYKSQNIFRKPVLPPGVPLEQLRFDGVAQGWEPSHDGRPGVFTCELSQNLRAEFGVTMTSTSDEECQISVDVTAFANTRQQLSDAIVAKGKAEADAGKAADALSQMQKSHATAAQMQGPTDKQFEVNAIKKEREDDADHFDRLVNEWRNKYESLSYVFPLSLRLANGVEVMQVEISLPKLPL